MRAALPFFLLSGISLILYLNPRGRLVLTVPEIRALMQVEGFALFFCMFLSVAIMGWVKRAETREHAELSKGEMTPLQGLVFLFFTAFVMGGAVMLAVGGFDLAKVYWLVLILHVLGTTRLAYQEMRLEAAANGWGMFVFIGLGFLAIKFPVLPRFGEYPAFDRFWGFRLEGHQMLGWACAYFAIFGILHLNKRRIFAFALTR